MIGIRNRVHMFAHPKNRQKIMEFFAETLAGEVFAGPPLPESIVVFNFSNGSSLSVDFTEDVDDALDERQARRGAWLELETDRPNELREKILDRGLHEFHYSPGFFYFQIPGGQVMRIKVS